MSKYMIVGDFPDEPIHYLAKDNTFINSADKSRIIAFKIKKLAQAIIDNN